MHVDWNWIKQRPHFLFEELTKYFEMDLFYVSKLVDKNTNKLINSMDVYSDSKTTRLLKVPFSGRNSLSRGIEQLCNHNHIKSISEYSHIWITSPIILDFIPLNVLKNKNIIYDCMDNFSGFYTTESFEVQKIVNKKEIDLIQHSAKIIVSSDYLKEKLVNNFKKEIKQEPVVVNNALSKSMLEDSLQNRYVQSFKRTDSFFDIMYIGTVGKWFDFELIIRVLNKFDNLTVTIIGPIEGTVTPLHARLKMIGPVDHRELPKYAAGTDAFIMPFKLNELVQAVDPVKMYEYISFMKPVISVDYEEMHKFSPFVNLYQNENELISNVEKLINGRLSNLNLNKVKEFLKENTWDKRATKIYEVLKDEFIKNKFEP